MLCMHRVVLSEDSGGSIEVYDDDADDDDMPPQLIIFPSLLGAGEDAVAGGARIGVSIEPRAELEHKEAARLGKKEEFAKRVALDLFRYLESFNQGGGHVAQISNDHLVVPANFLDRWFTKFQHKFRRDPDFLTRQTEKA